MPRDQEHTDQRTLVAWARHVAASGYVDAPGRGRVRLSDRQRLALRRTHAIPNGARTGRRQAGRLVAEGVLRGVPDLFVPYPRQSGGRLVGGLYVEMKTADGTVRPAQREVTQDLASLGYAVVIARGYDAGRRAILDHLLDS